MAELYLHIGAPKTGTSAIQAFLSRRRAALAAQGILYPEAGTINGAHHLLGAAIFPVRAKRLGADAETVLNKVAEDIHAEIATADPSRIILSSEYLWGETTPEAVRRLLEPFADHRLHLVAYLRRQDVLAQSIYAQAVKGGGVRTFEEWATAETDGGRAGLHFDRVLAPWLDCGVPIEVHVRVYEAGQIDPDVTHDFLSVVAPDAGIGKAAKPINISPDRITLELMRRMNRQLGPKAATSLRWRLAAVAQPRGPSTPFDFLDGEAAAAFMARFEDGNARIARELLGRPDGVLFRKPVDAAITRGVVNGTTMLDRLITLLPALLAPDEAAPAEPVAGEASVFATVINDDSLAKRSERRQRRRQRRERLAAAGAPLSIEAASGNDA